MLARTTSVDRGDSQERVSGPSARTEWRIGPAAGDLLGCAGRASGGRGVACGAHDRGVRCGAPAHRTPVRNGRRVVSCAAHARLQARRRFPARPATSRRPSSAWRTASHAASSTRRCSGATGTGKTCDDRLDHREAPAADAGAGPQQDARRAAVQRVPRVLPGQRRRVLRQLLRLLPAGGVPAPARHVHREGLVAATTRSTSCATRRRTRCSSGAT